jgi:hypothetical protein
MARKVQTLEDIEKRQKGAKKAEAEAAFKSPEKKPRGKKPKAVDEPTELKAVNPSQAEFKLPADRDALYHFTTIRGLRAKVDEANARLSNARKVAKEAGIEPEHINLVLKWQKHDPAELNAHLRKMAQMFKVGDLPVQFSIFDLSALSPEERALQEGHKAGKESVDFDANPYHPSSPEGQKWIEGLQRGRAELVMAMGPGAGHNSGEAPPAFADGDVDPEEFAEVGEDADESESAEPTSRYDDDIPGTDDPLDLPAFLDRREKVVA